MKTDKLQAELEIITENLGYYVRKEKGSFKGDFCVLEGDNIVMINSNYPAERNVGQLVRFLSRHNLDNMYIKPAVRKELKSWFERLKTEKG